MAGRLRFLPALAAVLAAAAAAQLPDPTRPTGAAAAGDAPGAADAANAGVQAVFLRQGAKPAALINGQYVEQGGRLGDRRVVRIGESEVVLRNADGSRETMKVIAGVDKRPPAEQKKAEKPTTKRSPAARRAAQEGATKHE
jgi:hypothetical protein